MIDFILGMLFEYQITTSEEEVIKFPIRVLLMIKTQWTHEYGVWYVSNVCAQKLWILSRPVACRIGSTGEYISCSIIDDELVALWFTASLNWMPFCYGATSNWALATTWSMLWHWCSGCKMCRVALVLNSEVLRPRITLHSQRGGESAKK